MSIGGFTTVAYEHYFWDPPKIDNVMHQIKVWGPNDSPLYLFPNEEMKEKIRLHHAMDFAFSRALFKPFSEKIRKIKAMENYISEHLDLLIFLQQKVGIYGDDTASDRIRSLMEKVLRDEKNKNKTMQVSSTALSVLETLKVLSKEGLEKVLAVEWVQPLSCNCGGMWRDPTAAGGQEEELMRTTPLEVIVNPKNNNTLPARFPPANNHFIPYFGTLIIKELPIVDDAVLEKANFSLLPAIDLSGGTNETSWYFNEGTFNEEKYVNVLRLRHLIHFCAAFLAGFKTLVFSKGNMESKRLNKLNGRAFARALANPIVEKCFERVIITGVTEKKDSFMKELHGRLRLTNDEILLSESGYRSLQSIGLQGLY